MNVWDCFVVVIQSYFACINTQRRCCAFKIPIVHMTQETLIHSTIDWEKLWSCICSCSCFCCCVSLASLFVLLIALDMHVNECVVILLLFRSYHCHFSYPFHSAVSLYTYHICALHSHLCLTITFRCVSVRAVFMFSHALRIQLYIGIYLSMLPAVLVSLFGFLTVDYSHRVHFMIFLR